MNTTGLKQDAFSQSESLNTPRVTSESVARKIRQLLKEHPELKSSEYSSVHSGADVYLWSLPI